MLAVAARQRRARVEADDIAQHSARAPQPDIAAVARNDRAVDHDIVALEVEPAVAVARGDHVAQRDVIGAALGRKPIAVAIVVHRVERVAHRDAIDRHIVHGVGEMHADREIVAVLKPAVAAHILDQNVIAVVLDADRALGIAVHGDVADREAGDRRAGVGARDHIVEEAGDVRRLDMLDRQVADVRADAKGRADILESQIAEAQIVRAVEQPEYLLARRHGRVEGLAPRAGDRRRHRIARAVDAADRHRRARRPARDDRQRAGRRGISALVGEQQHLAARPGRRDQLRQILQRRGVRRAGAVARAAAGGRDVEGRHGRAPVTSLKSDPPQSRADSPRRHPGQPYAAPAKAESPLCSDDRRLGAFARRDLAATKDRAGRFTLRTAKAPRRLWAGGRAHSGPPHPAYCQRLRNPIGDAPCSRTCPSVRRSRPRTTGSPPSR